jgi:hypothetical protein
MIPSLHCRCIFPSHTLSEQITLHFTYIGATEIFLLFDLSAVVNHLISIPPHLDAVPGIDPQRPFARIHARLFAGLLLLRVMSGKGQRQAYHSAARRHSPDHLHAVPERFRPASKRQAYS